MLKQIRIAARSLTRSPRFTAAALVALAVGIGAATAVFSVVDAVLLRPLPYGDPDRVVRLYSEWDETPEGAVSPAEALDYLAETQGVFDALGFWATGSVNIQSDGTPERVPAAFVSEGALRALGVSPVRGRGFTPKDDVPGSTVALLGHGLWTRRYAGDDDVVGRDITVNGQRVQVIGVMPATFRLPTGFAPGAAADLYFPLGLDAAAVPARGSHFLAGVARLADGASVGTADARLAELTSGFARAYPDDYPRDMRFGAYVVPALDDIVGDVRPTLWMLFGAVAFVLLIACVNVAALMLTRADARRREFAVRTALGAGRGRLAGELLLESSILTLAAAALGVLLATWGSAGLVALQPPDLPRVYDVGLSMRVLGVALAAALVTALVFGLMPLAGGSSWADALRDGGRGGGVPRRRLRQALITGEVALALVLLSGAGLMIRSFANLIGEDPGYRTERVLTTRISLPSASYPDDASRRDFFAALTEHARELPGVESAGAVSNLPLASTLGDLNIRIEGRPVRDGEVSPRLDWQVVTPGYFETMDIAVVQGRGIEAQDDERATGAVVLNEAAAALHFPGESALGKRFVLGGGAAPGEVTVVGVVEDVRHGTLGAPPRAEMYLPHRQFMFWNGGSAVGTLSVVVRAAGEPAALASAVRATVAELDPLLPPGAFQTMAEVTAASLSRWRFALTVLAMFAAIALLLAAVGIYGLIAYTVSRRAQEIGVRIALGARRSQVAAMVVRQGAGVILVGLVIGLLATLPLTGALTGLLYGIEPHDPATLLAVAATLGGVGLLACLAPARWVARLDPVHALRAQ